MYPCLIAGILLLVRRRSPGRDREGLIDSLIIAVGIGVISWVFLMVPIAHDADSTLIQKLVSMGYPFMDLVLLTVVARLVIGGGPARSSFYLMPAAVLALFVTDFVYSYISVQGLVYDQSGIPRSGVGELLHPLGRGGAAPVDARAVGARAGQKNPGSRASGSCCWASRRCWHRSVLTIQLLRGENNDLWVITARRRSCSSWS